MNTNKRIDEELIGVCDDRNHGVSGIAGVGDEADQSRGTNH